MARTSIPSAGRKRTASSLPRNMTTEMTASESFRLKYQWPAAEGLKLEISPWMLTPGKPSSRVVLMSWVISLTE